MPTDQPRRIDGTGRDVASVLGGLLVVGVLCGVLWSLVVTPAAFTKLRDGGAMGEEQLSKQFAADGWYLMIALVAGFLAAVVLVWWRSRDPLVTSGLVVLGSMVAAVAMALTGHLLGPGDPRAALAAARVGGMVPERLDVGAFLVYLSWPVGVLAGTLFVLLGRSPVRDPGDPVDVPGPTTAETPSATGVPG